MSVRWWMAVGLFLALFVAPASAGARNATTPVEPGAPPPPVGLRFPHHKKLTATYDTLSDSTRLAESAN